jgi:hypothetical protein
LQDLTWSQREAAKDLLKQLFPQIENGDYDESAFEANQAQGKRVASAAYFSRYLQYAVPSSQIADLPIQSFLHRLPQLGSVDENC